MPPHVIHAQMASPPPEAHPSLPRDPIEIAAQLGLHPLILGLRRRLVDLLALHTADTEFGPIETLLLRIIAHTGVDTPTLCGLAALDIATFSRSIKLLHEKGLVVAPQAPQDKRRKIYQLTLPGQAAAIRATEAAKRTEADFLAPLPPRDQRLFIRLLTKLTLAHAVNGTIAQDPRIAEFLGGDIDPGTLARRAIQLSVHFYGRECGDKGWSPLEAVALSCIARYGSIQVKDLSRLLAIDRGSAFAIVEKFRQQGALETSDLDSRSLSLTPPFQAAGVDVSACLARCDTHMLDVLTRDERPRLMRVIRRLHASMAQQASHGT